MAKDFPAALVVRWDECFTSDMWSPFARCISIPSATYQFSLFSCTNLLTQVSRVSVHAEVVVLQDAQECARQALALDSTDQWAHCSFLVPTSSSETSIAIEVRAQSFYPCRVRALLCLVSADPHPGAVLPRPWWAARAFSVSGTTNATNSPSPSRQKRRSVSPAMTFPNAQKDQGGLQSLCLIHTLQQVQATLSHWPELDVGGERAAQVMAQPSRFKDDAFERGLGRPFLLLASLHPRQRAQWAAAFGLPFEGGDPHREAFEIFDFSDTGFHDCVVLATDGKLIPGEPWSWFQLLYAVAEAFFVETFFSKMKSFLPDGPVPLHKSRQADVILHKAAPEEAQEASVSRDPMSASHRQMASLEEMVFCYFTELHLCYRCHSPDDAMAAWKQAVAKVKTGSESLNKSDGLFRLGWRSSTLSLLRATLEWPHLGPDSPATPLHAGPHEPPLAAVFLHTSPMFMMHDVEAIRGDVDASLVPCAALALALIRQQIFLAASGHSIERFYPDHPSSRTPRCPPGNAPPPQRKTNGFRCTCP
eukprot:EG_transcript_8035